MVCSRRCPGVSLCLLADAMEAKKCNLRTANGCYKDAADLRGELDDFNEAIALYEKVADHSLTSPLTRYSVKEYWLKACLCGIAVKVSIYDYVERVVLILLPIGSCVGQKKSASLCVTRYELPFHSGGQICDCFAGCHQYGC